MPLKWPALRAGQTLAAPDIVIIGKCQKPGKIPGLRVDELAGAILRRPTGAVWGNLQQGPTLLESGLVVLKLGHGGYATSSSTTRDLSALSLAGDTICKWSKYPR